MAGIQGCTSSPGIEAMFTKLNESFRRRNNHWICQSFQIFFRSNFLWHYLLVSYIDIDEQKCAFCFVFEICLCSGSQTFLVKPLFKPLKKIWCRFIKDIVATAVFLWIILLWSCLGGFCCSVIAVSAIFDKPIQNWMYEQNERQQAEGSLLRAH